MYDRNRKEISFKEGDKVYVKVQPYWQHTVLGRTNQKLAPKFVCPFPILKCVSHIACKVQLPVDSKIHDVFHVSLLRLAVIEGMKTEAELLTLLEENGTLPCFLEKVLPHLVHNSCSQILAKWLGATPELETWEATYRLQ